MCTLKEYFQEKVAIGLCHQFSQVSLRWKDDPTYLNHINYISLKIWKSVILPELVKSFYVEDVQIWPRENGKRVNITFSVRVK